MKFVPDLGWSRETVIAGAEFIGYPGVIHGMFTNAGAELVQYFYSTSNNELNKILKKKSETVKTDFNREKELPSLQIYDAIKIRLTMIIPYKKTWPQAMGLMSLPSNVPTALNNLLTLIDDICYYTGDRSVDIHWYTRRLVLTGIYKTTELYMLQDQSEDHKQTWEFLERRIENAMQLHKAATPIIDIQYSKEVLNQSKEIANATLITVRNILGLRYIN